MAVLSKRNLRFLLRAVVWGIAGCVAGRVSAEQPTDTVSDSILFQGQVLFAQNCSVGYCHGKGGRAGRGPRLRGRELSAHYLREVIEKGIPNSSMRSWGDRLVPGEIEALVAFIQVLSELQRGDPDPVFGGGPFSAVDIRPITDKPVVEREVSDVVGNPERGRLLFFDSGDAYNCAHCHTIEGRGTEIGPDLGRLATAPARLLLREILTPNAFVMPYGRVIEMVTTRGDSLRVMRLGETETRVTVFDITELPPVKRNIKKSRITMEKRNDRSAMPEIYAQHYTMQQLLDLISFIKSGSGGLPVAIEDLF